jgi:hypothetical protein
MFTCKLSFKEAGYTYLFTFNSYDKLAALTNRQWKYSWYRMLVLTMVCYFTFCLLPIFWYYCRSEFPVVCHFSRETLRLSYHKERFILVWLLFEAFWFSISNSQVLFISVLNHEGLIWMLQFVTIPSVLAYKDELHRFPNINIAKWRKFQFYRPVEPMQ